MSLSGPEHGAPESPRLLRAVFGTTFFIRFGFGLTVSVFASYFSGQSLGLDVGSVGQVGFLSSLAPIGEFATVLLSGLAADRFGRFPILLGGTVSAAILLAAMSFGRAAVLLGGVNFLFGVASGAILAASLAVVADQSGPSERGFEMGRFDAVNLLGYILGFASGFAALGALPNFELPWLFRVGAAVLLVGFVFALRSVRGYVEPPFRKTFELHHIRAAVLRRDVLLVVLPWFVIYMLLGTAFVFLGSAATGIGLPTSWLAALIGGGGLLLLLTQPWFGRQADRRGRPLLLTLGTVGFVALLGIAGLLAQYGPRPYLLAGVGVSALLALGYGPAALASLADVSESLSRGTTMAVYSLVISAGMVVGLWVSSALYSAYAVPGLDLFFLFVASGLVLLTVARLDDLVAQRAALGLRGHP
ncbi:MAG: MFS transporter [Thermoplasmata archaeon]|nr:MFS transporter [Thermoplasmata archaeon]